VNLQRVTRFPRSPALAGVFPYVTWIGKLDFPEPKEARPDGTLECVGGPLDGKGLSPMRGEIFRPMRDGWTGTYVRHGSEYRWEPD
jgi:hypothetical protein